VHASMYFLTLQHTSRKPSHDLALVRVYFACMRPTHPLPSGPVLVLSPVDNLSTFSIWVISLAHGPRLAQPVQGVSLYCLLRLLTQRTLLTCLIDLCAGSRRIHSAHFSARLLMTDLLKRALGNLASRFVLPPVCSNATLAAADTGSHRMGMSHSSRVISSKAHCVCRERGV
jgi:hypothetical protein